MPSSGYGIENIIGRGLPERDQEPGFDPNEFRRRVDYVNRCAKAAYDYGMLVEWLGSFIAAWKQGADCYQAAQAGLIEWDL